MFLRVSIFLIIDIVFSNSAYRFKNGRISFIPNELDLGELITNISMFSRTFIRRTSVFEQFSKDRFLVETQPKLLIHQKSP